MHREAVAAEQGHRVVRGGTDERDALPARRIERQDAVVPEHDGALPGDLAGQRDGGRRLQIDGAFVRVRLLEQAEADLFGDDASHDGVDRLDRDEPALDRFAQVGGAVVGGQFDVKTGVEREGRRLGTVAGEVVVLVEEADADVVGDDQAVESPLVTEHAGEQVARRVARLVVDVVVHRHHRSGTRLLHRHLEGQQEDVVQLAPPEVHRPVVARALAPRVTGEVLQRRQHVALRSLQASDEPGAQHADQIRVFAQRLLGATPAHVARHVEHRRQPLVAPHRAGLAPDGPGRPLDEVRIPRRAIGERRREHRCAARHQADEALLVRQRRNPEPRLLAQELLQPVESADARARVDTVAAERPRDLPESLVQRLLHDVRVRAAGEVVLAGTMSSVVGEDQPERMHLRRLFLEGHSGEQVGRTLVNGPAGILVGMRHGRDPPQFATISITPTEWGFISIVRVRAYGRVVSTG